LKSRMGASRPITLICGNEESPAGCWAFLFDLSGSGSLARGRMRAEDLRFSMGWPMNLLSLIPPFLSLIICDHMEPLRAFGFWLGE
jgi:hypothetical protein